MLVDKLLLNGSTDFDEIFCVSSGGFHNGLDKQFGPIKIVYLFDFFNYKYCGDRKSVV